MSENSEARRNWYLANRERAAAYGKKFRDKNAEDIRDKKREYRHRNIEKISNQKKLWYERNRDYVSAKGKRYREANKAAQVEYGKVRNSRKKQRRATDPFFALKSRIRALIWASLRNRGLVKSERTEKILGCGMLEFMIHIERQFQDGMSWDNRSLWHIDHIVPMSSAKNSDEVLALNNFKNLRPLWAADNLRKGSRVDFNEILSDAASVMLDAGQL